MPVEIHESGDAARQTDLKQLSKAQAEFETNAHRNAELHRIVHRQAGFFRIEGHRLEGVKDRLLKLPGVEHKEAFAADVVRVAAAGEVFVALGIHAEGKIRR